MIEERRMKKELVLVAARDKRKDIDNDDRGRKEK